MIAELGTQSLAIRELRWIETGDVTGEVEVVLRPLADRREIGTERVGDDVFGIADEDRAITKPVVTRPLFDHLGVVVSGERSLGVTTVGHR